MEENQSYFGKRWGVQGNVRHFKYLKDLQEGDAIFNDRDGQAGMALIFIMENTE